ncbi:serine/threonine protein kinase [Trapelia coarctata]|nr:serine/threonine protein kinase [Trapelia coarctata]
MNVKLRIRTTTDDSPAVNVDTAEEVAIKLEHVSIDPSLLREEVEVYKSLAGGAGIPNVYWFGWECEYGAMVFELLGPSLEDLFNYCGRQFSLKTILLIADQLICRLQYIHSRDVIHRDIKPENFLLGTGKKGNCIYVTDLGLAVEYRSNRAPVDASPSVINLLGTARFASVKGHLGVEQCRRDDMESLGYMLLYLLRGRLPWQGLKAKTDQERNKLIMEKKANIGVEELCDQAPPEFAAYMDYIRALKFDDKPNYSRLRKSFQSLFVRCGYKYDNVFDWTIRRFLELDRQQKPPSAESANAQP